MSLESEAKKRIPEHLKRELWVCVYGIWAVGHILMISSTTFSNLFSFFDEFVLDGVTAHAACPTGDPINNARTLMFAWLMGCVLIVSLLYKVGDAKQTYEYIKWGAFNPTRPLKRLRTKLLVTYIAWWVWSIYGLYRYSFDATSGCLTALNARGVEYNAFPTTYQSFIIFVGVHLLYCLFRCHYGWFLSLFILNKRD